MKKTALIYHSKHGSTEKYAKWIAEETGADLFKDGEVKAADLAGYDRIIYGGAIHSGGIMGIEFLKKNRKKFADKEVLAFGVGLMIDDPDTRQQCLEINFRKKMAGTPCWFFKGAYDPAVVKGFDAKVMGVVKKMIKSKGEFEVTKNELEILDVLENGADFVDRSQIAEFVEYLKNEEKQS